MEHKLLYSRTFIEISSLHYTKYTAVFKYRGADSNKLFIYLSALFSETTNSGGAKAPPPPPLTTALKHIVTKEK